MVTGSILVFFYSLKYVLKACFSIFFITMCGRAVQNKCKNVEDLFYLFFFFHSVMWWVVFDNKAWGGGGMQLGA